MWSVFKVFCKNKNSHNYDLCITFRLVQVGGPELTQAEVIGWYPEKEVDCCSSLKYN